MGLVAIDIVNDPGGSVTAIIKIRKLLKYQLHDSIDSLTLLTANQSLSQAVDSWD